MESLVPILRLTHFLGLALFLGGIACSFVLVKKTSPSRTSAFIAWNCMHLVGTPGLVILILSGFIQSMAYNFAHFKDAGYMHLKIILVLTIFVMVFLDMKLQKKLLQDKSASEEELVQKIKKRQKVSLATLVLTFFVMFLISYRPF